MKISCNQQNLAKTLSIVSRALGSRQLPILENILITADPVANTITCAATNLEIAIKITVAAEITTESESNNQALLPGKQLTDIVHSFSSGRGAHVEITATESGALIKCGKSNFKLPVAPVAEFPEIKQPSGDGFTVSAETFVEAVKQTIYATDLKDSRPFVQSILFDINDINKEQNQLTLAGTDANRLAVKNIPIENGLNVQIMVPAILLRKIADVVTGDQIQFHVVNNQLFATFGDSLIKNSFISVRLMNGQYPQYQRMILNDFAGQMTLNRVEFIQVLERASLIDHEVLLRMAEDEDEDESEMVLQVSSKANNGSGQFQEEIALIKHSGEPQFLNGYNVRYLLEFLKSINTDTVEINYLGTAKPVLMQGSGDKSCRYVCMPVKLPETRQTAA